MTSSCVPDEVDISSTETPGPATFTGKAVPFFRGRVCVNAEVQSGTSFPVFVSPCLHPCITSNQFEFKHFFNCVGSTCEAWVVMWVVADSEPSMCPPDAFSDFDETMCQYDNPVEVKIDASTSAGPVQGSMLLEVPFLSNDDMADIVAAGADTTVIEDKIFQYPRQQNRIANDGNPISILSSNPAPPATCGDDGAMCDCFNRIGF